MIFGNSPRALIAITAGIVWFSGQTVMAQTQRQFDAHEHGTAVLNLAQDEQIVYVEFQSPAVNIVGFEHEPHDDDDQKKIDDATATLEGHPDLLSFTAGAACSLVTAHAEFTHEDDHDDDHDKEHAKDDHDDDHDKEHAKDDHDDDHDKEHAKDDHDDDHDKEHAKDDHDDDHDKEHAKDDHDEEHADDGHAEFLAKYEFKCQSPDQLSDMSTQLFELFPGLESLQVNAATSRGQTAATLSREANGMSF